MPYDPALPVDTDWDLGIGDAMAIWFSQSLRPGEVRLIDYYENSGEGLPFYAGVLKDKGYVYGEHWAPHDIRVRELGTGKRAASRRRRATGSTSRSSRISAWTTGLTRHGCSYRGAGSMRRSAGWAWRR